MKKNNTKISLDVPDVDYKIYFGPYIYLVALKTKASRASTSPHEHIYYCNGNTQKLYGKLEECSEECKEFRRDISVLRALPQKLFSLNLEL